ncbi:MAG: hypothetical protein HOQ36_02905 [Nocardia sp.]|nr:hypothetical protein [Nocardia sp.]
MTVEADSAPFVVGIVADPDLPARLAHGLATRLPALLALRSDGARWRVEVSDEPFEAMYPDLEYLIDKAGRHVRETSWDFALCLTDLPMGTGGRVVLGSLDVRRRVALISLPALGGIRLRSRLRHLVTAMAGVVIADETRQPRPELGGVIRSVRASDLDDGTVLLERAGRGRFAGLLAGMVRANRPWRLFIGLSSALAGAVAGSAFGVLYSNVWQLATAIGPARLAGVVLVAVTALTAWIIVGHNLWERSTSTEPAGVRDNRLRNGGTVVTVALGAIIFFLVLFLCTVAAVALVIPSSYLATVLGRPVHFADYVTIAVMASALGTLAGAIGSGLEDDISVRRATYGYRDRERRNRVDRDEGAGQG